MIIAIVIMGVTGALQISFSINSVNATLILPEIAIAATIIIAVLSVTYKFSQKYAKRNIVLKRVKRWTNEN